MRERILIPPVPKEYAEYSEQEKIAKTERYYSKVRELYDKIDGCKEEYEKKVGAVFEKQANSKEILTILSEESAQLLCHYTNEFALLKLLCKIAATEEEFGEPCLLQNIHSLEGVTEWYQKGIFLIRRFEFGWEEDEELLDLMRQSQISYIAVAELICVNDIIQKVCTVCRIADYLHKNGCKREAVLFIMRLEQILPYSERKVMHFAMTLLDMGETHLAYEVLMKHQNPDEDVKELQRSLNNIL